MMDKRNLLKLMVLALGVSVLLFVFGYPRGVQPIDEHTIRYVIEQEPSTLDPAKSTTSPEATVQLQLFDGLVRLNDESEPEAALAKNWDISDDGREYTFHLRPNLKWSNGEPLTAYDFEYAWKRVLDPEVHADNAYMLYVLENGEAFNTGKAAAEDVGVKAIDEDTLVVTLENPTAYFLKLLASHSYYPVSKKAVEAHENWAANAETIVSNGPYRLLSWKHNGEMDFIKNPNYWDAESVKTENDHLEGNHFCPIIERNTVIPASRTQHFFTVYDHQTQVEIHILQGESRFASNNVSLGTLKLTVPDNEAGKEQIDITYTYDINALLEVEAKIVSTGETVTRLIKNQENSMTEEEMKARMRELSYLKIPPREQEKNKVLLLRGERLYEETTGELREQLEMVTQQFERILDRQDPLKIEEARKDYEEALDWIEEEMWI